MSQPPYVSHLDSLSKEELRRLLIEQLTRQKLGLYWEANAIERDKALNANVVLPRLIPEFSWSGPSESNSPIWPHLIIEGDNFDSLRLLRATHRGRIRVIYIDPPYNTGNKDWVYNDRFVGANDRWRHSLWLEFLYRRLTLARDLLTSDGVILVSINDENRARLELLMDEVFPGRRLGSLVWRTKDTGNDLSQRFSHVHEHVLVYANPGFQFNGRATDRSKFRNPDADPRGDWAPRPITANKTLVERANTYYPIEDPKTGLWYPCDPESVWRYASEKRMPTGQKLRTETIEELIRQELIYFPPCKPNEVLRYDSMEALLAAIRTGTGPCLPKKKTPLFREDLPDLADWIGRPIAPGRPSRKDHWNSKPENERLAPLSSWIAGINEDAPDDADEEENIEVLRSERGGVATEEVKAIFGTKAFQHPKPLSLIKGLLSQASKPGDIVLDFFGGSGTTGQAVLELNAEDNGVRRFILCSSTEATEKEPDKNLCRDVCAGRIRKVLDAGKYADSGYAYLQLEQLEAADVAFEATAEHAHALLTLRETRQLRTAPTGPIKPIAQDEHGISLLCTTITQEVLETLASLPHTRLTVYSPRPTTVAEHLERAGKQVESLAVTDALLLGQQKPNIGTGS